MHHYCEVDAKDIKGIFKISSRTDTVNAINKLKYHKDKVKKTTDIAAGTPQKSDGDKVSYLVCCCFFIEQIHTYKRF